MIDSFKAIHDLSTSLPEMRRMLYEISGLLTAYDTTAFLLGEYSDDQIPVFPEFAVADGMVELARKKLGTRDERYLRVLKLRGSTYQEGLHAFRITADGLDVFPRLTSPDVPLSLHLSTRRGCPPASPGSTACCEAACGRGGSTLLEGRPAPARRRSRCSSSSRGCGAASPGSTSTSRRTRPSSRAAIAEPGLDIEEAKRKGLHLLYASPVELQIDSILVDAVPHDRGAQASSASSWMRSAIWSARRAI